MGTETLRVGIIGCGALGLHHARRFTELPDVQVTALSDPDAAGISRVQAALPTPAATVSPDYRDILDAGLDAVLVASPDGFHVPQVLDALAANLHVLCEKPLTPDPDELDAIVASRDEVGKVVCMTYPRRYDGSARAMRREILSGGWGPVQFITAYNAENWKQTNIGTWRLDPELCPGGFLYDANGHQIDLILWATGLRHESARARIDMRDTPVPIWTWGDASLTGGVPMTFSFVGDAHRWREQINIHCADRDFIIENGRCQWLLDGRVQPIAPTEPGEPPAHAFIHLLREGGENWSPPEGIRPLQAFTNEVLKARGERREESPGG